MTKHGIWEPLEPLPENIHGNHLQLTIDRKILAFGGSTQNCYILDGQKWAFHSKLNEYRKNAVAIAMPNGIFVFGGHENPISSEFLPNGSTKWQLGPSFPNHCHWSEVAGDDFAGCKISNDEFVVVRSSHMFKYNINNNQWKYFCKLNFRRTDVCIAKFGDKLIIIGGRQNPYGGYISVTEIVQLTNGESWIADGDLNVPRRKFGMSTVKIEGKLRLIAFGGLSENSAPLDSIEIWNEESETWKLSQINLPKDNWDFGYISYGQEDMDLDELLYEEPKSYTSIKMLPNEILSEIFKYLKMVDLNQCYNVSQKWREFAETRLCKGPKPQLVQVVAKPDSKQLEEIYSTFEEDINGKISISMPNGMYIFGNPSSLLSGIGFKYHFQEIGSNVWQDGPDFPLGLYPQPNTIHDAWKDFTSYEISAGYKISNEEFIVIMNRHIMKYNIWSKNWSHFVKLKFSRRESCSIVFDGKLMIAGGTEIPNGNMLAETELVDLSNGKAWICGTLQTPRTGLKMDVFNVNGKLRIVAFEGEDEFSEKLKSIEIWHEKLQSWKLSKMVLPYEKK